MLEERELNMKRNNIVIIALLVALLLLYGCNQAQTPLNTDKPVETQLITAEQGGTESELPEITQGIATQQPQITEEIITETDEPQITEPIIESEEPQITESVTQSPDITPTADIGPIQSDEPIHSHEIIPLDEKGSYTSPQEVVTYIRTYGHLPSNYITLEEAKQLGYDGTGDLWSIVSGKSIGGDLFDNNGKINDDGRTYYVCDVNYAGGARGSERIVYSQDGECYYSDDNCETLIEMP